MRLQRFAGYPEGRRKVCLHAHKPFRGKIPCTGPLQCTMCGLLFDPDTRVELPGQDQDVMPRAAAIQALLDFVRGKAEAGRIDWENDAPVFEGLCEEVEASICRIFELEEAVRSLLDLLHAMQTDSTRFLHGYEECDSRWYINRMLFSLDGPCQRRVEAMARAALGQTDCQKGEETP